MAAAAPYLRQERPGNYTWVLVALGLLGVAVASGVSLAYGELQAFYAAISVALCLAIFADFRIGVVVLIVTLPLHSTTLFPRGMMGITGLNPANLLLAATLASYLLRGRLEEIAKLVRPQLVWLCLVPIAIAGAIGAFHAEDVVPIFYERELVNFIGPLGYIRDLLLRPMLLVVLALLLGAAAARAQKPERFLVPIAISVWIMALVMIVYVIQSGVSLGQLSRSTERGFFEPLGFHSNGVGRLLAAVYALLLFPWWETKKAGLKLFLFLTMGVLSVALLLTFSRGAFTGFILVNLLFLAWKFNLRTLLLAIAAVTVLVIFTPGYVVGRVTVGFATGEADHLTAGRTDGIWMPLLPELAKSPVWGNGLGSTMWLDPQQRGAMLPVTHPHNAYLEALLDMGVIGLGLLLAFFWHVWRGFRALGSSPWLGPEMRALFQGAAAALACFIVTGMAGSSLRPDPDFSYLWLAIGLMYGMKARKPTD